MADPHGFLKAQRVPYPMREPSERVGDYGEIYGTLPEPELRRQGARCMDCGVPFCNHACPLGNLIPDWNDLARTGRWREGIDRLHATNNFPEFTGLICPAPCESACVLAIDDDPVMIKQIEYWLIDHAFDQGWVEPRRPRQRTGKSVGVIGSGPAGLAAAAELNAVGHAVVVYERDEAAGGMLRFGVPDAKLEKWIIDRRLRVLEAEGVELRYGVEVGVDLPVAELRERHDALLLAVGARVERELDIPGSKLGGVHLAMSYLYQRNRAVARAEGRPAPPPEREPISAAGKRVVVVGGGDTGMDCLSNALREGAEDVLLLDVYPEVPPGGRYANTPWPMQPRRLATTYALDEGGERQFARQVTAIGGSERVEWIRGRQVRGQSSQDLVPVPGSEFTAPADLVLVAVGFSGAEPGPLLDGLDIGLSRPGKIRAGTFATATDGVFAAGDCRVGASLVVTAIADGRRCARVVDHGLRAAVLG